jgi:pimeloyl-ACP methyl ester carboxylesterase
VKDRHAASFLQALVLPAGPTRLRTTLVHAAWGAVLIVTVGFAQDPLPVKRMQVNGTDIAYVEQGTGPPVVLVLGGVGDYRVWTRQLADFSTRHRTIAYSFRYHYPNARAAEDAEYSVPLHVADLAALIRILDLGPAHLVGYSYGASVAAFVAGDHPQLVRSLVLAEPPLYSLLADHPEAKALLAERGTAMSRVQDALKADNGAEAIKRFLDFTLAPASFSGLHDDVRSAMLANAAVLRLLLRSTPAPFTCEHAMSIRAPSLLVTGARTVRLFTITLDELEKCLRHRERMTLSGTAHGLPFENPAVFNEAVLRFLARQ